MAVEEDSRLSRLLSSARRSPQHQHHIIDLRSTLAHIPQITDQYCHFLGLAGRQPRGAARKAPSDNRIAFNGQPSQENALLDPDEQFFKIYAAVSRLCLQAQISGHAVATIACESRAATSCKALPRQAQEIDPILPCEIGDRHDLSLLPRRDLMKICRATREFVLRPFSPAIFAAMTPPILV